MKYDPLKRHLAKLARDQWLATFSEIEEVLGFRLPRSARIYQAWWGNQEYSSQSNAWQEAGWKVTGLNLGSEKISFIRDGQTKLRAPKRKKMSSSPREGVRAIIPQWDDRESIAASLQMTWQPIGCVSFDAGGRLTFPPTPKIAGLYRFRIRAKGKAETRYVGESVNIHQRFNQNYRHGNATQHTSHRIHKVLKDALHNKSEVSVSIIIENAWVIEQGKKMKADFNLKAMRRLFENFAQCIEGDTPVEPLNL